MDNLWGSVEASRWREVPFISARVATEEDVASGAAVFYIQGESEPESITLPACAIQKLEDGSTEQVIVIQAEKTPHGVYLGVRPLVGGNGICTIEEVEFVPAGFAL
jgi:hypothetical protein